MNHVTRSRRRSAVGVLLGCTACLLFAEPAPAQFPEPSCNPATWPANAAVPAAVGTYCADHSGMDCSLEIDDWSLPGDTRSTGIRIGSAIDGSPEQPHFLFDEAGNRFYAKLYLRFRNGGLGPAPADQVSVDLAYKEGDTPADPNVDTGWTAIGTYDMTIPAPATVGALFPNETHVQDSSRPVCWTFPAGDTDLPRKFTLRATIDWAQDDVPDNDRAFSFYDLTTQERKAQIGFVMDLSGSMAGARLLQAQQKAGLFTHLIEDGDQLGVYGFATDNPASDAGETATYTPTPPGPDVMVTFDDTSEIAPVQTLESLMDRVNIAGAIAAQSAHNCTPVGQGLLRAREEMTAVTPPDNAQKAIVIFSDGLQNVPPFVNTPPLWPCENDPAAPLIDAEATFGGDDIQIYSVFFTSAWAFGATLMDDIQDQTGGDLLFGTATEAELAAAYFAIRGLVDDMIFLDEDGVTSPQSPGTFEVEFDAAADRATVGVSWPTDDGATRLAVECRPKGSADWRECEPSDGRQPLLTHLPQAPAPSYEVFRFEPGPGTTWQFRVVQERPRTGRTPYTAAVFSPVREAQIFPSLDNVGFEAGRPLPIRAALRRDGVGVTGASVDAVVRVPTRNFGATLRRYADRLDPPATGDSRAVAVVGQLQKLLAQDTGSDAVYLYRDVPVALRDDGSGDDTVAGDGIYSGVLPGSETEVAGDYQVTLTARLTLPSGRTVQRVAKLSALCGVGPADPERSTVRTAVRPDPVHGARVATVTVLPTDRFGNAAFPGSGSRIRVTPAGGALQGDLVDNLDSTFTQTVVLDPDDPRPTVTVAVGGVSLGSTPVIPRPERPAARNELSLHLGLAVPHGTLGTFFDDGPSLGLDFARVLDPNLAFKVELVADDFDGVSGGSEEMLSLSTYLQYRKPTGPWTPYFETGIGIYDFIDTSAFGFSGGLGAQRRLAPRWSLDFNVQGHRVGGSLDASFSRLRVGLIYNP